MTKSTEPSLAVPWGTHRIPPDETLTIRVGPLVLWARAPEGEMWLAHRSGDWTRSAKEPAREPSSEHEDWVRWPVPEGTDRISLSPIFPPRSVVAEPELSFRLLPRAGARVFVRVPLWVRVEIAGPRHLTEIPSVVLSDTWWGSFTDGELCYWLATTARRRVPADVFAPHLAVCPLQLSNDSDEELQVEKIALRVAHLSVFDREGRFWADETRVRYRGADEGSHIQSSGKPPAEESEATLVAPPRTKPPARGFRALTFARLKALSGLGGI